MRIGVPRESKPGETRVAATPKTVQQILKLGYDVAVESGAGLASSYPDAAFTEAGADVVGANCGQVILQKRCQRDAPSMSAAS